jgi:hypothetical protein
MKCIFWNARGLANPPSRLALKHLILQNNPDIVLLSEPWMPFDDFPSRWLANLNLKLFALNNRNNLLPNLWCLCKLSLNPFVLATDDQHVSFTIFENDKTFAISAVYASTNYRNRRKLWNALNSLQAQHDLPWSFFGDFNVILGAHEHRDRTSPARLPIEEFQNWSESFNLVHLPTRGVEFTWNNGRGGNRHTERRLDRVICNQSWMDLCNTSSVTALSRIRSDHFPLLFDFQTSTVRHVSQFKFLKMWSLHSECKNVIMDSWNENVVGCPMFVLSQKLKNLKVKLKCWNKNSFGNVHDLVSTAELNLKQIQALIQENGHSDALLLEERSVSATYEDALNKQEAF